MRQHRPAPAQHGVATLLFLLLTGLALGALVFGAVSHVRGAQSQALTVHALTQAQLRAWVGAEALRQYLYQLGETEAAALQAGQAVTLAGLEGVSAQVASVDADDNRCAGGTRVGLSVVGSSGGANSLLSVFYCAVGNGPGPGPEGPYDGGDPSTPIQIKGSLQLSGDLRITSNDTARVLVDGSVSGTGSLQGIDSLYASGDVTLGGNTSIDSVFSEGNVELSGGGSYTTVKSMKDIELSGGVAAGSLVANGSVAIQSNSVTSIVAIGDVIATAAPIVSLRTGGNMKATNTRITGSAEVKGDYNEFSAGAVAGGSYGGTLFKPDWNNLITMTRVPGLQVPIAALTAETLTLPTIDAYAYRAAANYQFDRDTSNRTIVTVNQVNGVPNGTYYLAGDAGRQDYLCTSTTYAAASCLAKICVGYSDYNSCFAYSNGTWSINGTTMAPGVAWFKGNLSAGTGTYYNSFIATGNITTAGANVTYAVNWAGHANVCANARFGSLFPSNFCIGGSTTMAVNATGNIAFAAGGYEGTTFVGGRIDLSASNDVYGDVLAGDVIQTGGSTTVHGVVTAAQQGGNAGSSSFGASTRIDLVDPPQAVRNARNAGTQGATARMLWSRYQ